MISKGVTWVELMARSTPPLRAYWASIPLGQGFDPCDEFDVERMRPPQPEGEDCVWYRGWEVGYGHDAVVWSKYGWMAYKGGCDLDAPSVCSTTYEGCLDAIDDEEDEA